MGVLVRKEDFFLSFYRSSMTIVVTVGLLIPTMFSPVRAVAQEDCTEAGLRDVGVVVIDCDGDIPSSSNAVNNLCGGEFTPTQGSENIERIFNFFRSKGLTKEQAAGVAGNAQAESGGDPTIVSSLNYHGIFQWDDIDRWPDVVAWAAANTDPETGNPYDPLSLSAQMEFSYQEALGRGNIAGIQQYQTFDLAAWYWGRFYEVAIINGSLDETELTNVQHLDRRIGYAAKILDDYGDNETTPGPSSSASTLDEYCRSNQGVSGSGGSGTVVPTEGCSLTGPVWGSQNGSGQQYSQEQLARLFGDPGTGSGNGSIPLVSVDFLGKSVSIHEVAAGCLEAVAADLANSSYQIKQMGCYRFDSDNGSSNIGLKSYHTYGLACDINPNENPYVKGGTAAYDMPQDFIQAFRNRGFTWGGNWVSVKDYMHFEFNGIRP